jgi:MFS family permease
MLGARIGVGVSEAAVAPTAYSMIADGFPKARLTTAIAIFQTGIKAGQATAFGLTGLLLAVVPVMTFGGFQLAPWRTIMILFAIPGLVAGLLLYTSRSPHREPRVVTEGQPGTLKAFAAQNRKILVKFLVGFLLADLCSAALVSWTPTFVSRTYAWSPEHYGPLMGVLSIAAAVVLVFKGYAVDWLYARGMKDAHIRFYCWLLAASLPIGFTLFHVSSPYLFFGMYAFLQLVMISFASFATASISTLAPAYLRARLIAIFLLLVNIVGGGLGPIIIGALNDYVFRDPMKIGLSLTTLISIAMPGALIFLWWVLKDWRAAIERSERTDDTSVGRGSPSQ